MRLALLLLGICALAHTQKRRVGRFTEVYAWKQMTYNIDGNILTQDRATSDGLETRNERHQKHNKENSAEESQEEPVEPSQDSCKKYFDNDLDQLNCMTENNFLPDSGSSMDTSSDTSENLDESTDNFFIKYNNLPMGAERVGDRLFVSLPRRRYGIPATLNYIDLRDTSRSPHLHPYPSLKESAGLVNVYRPRADKCGRLWVVDTGLLELPVNARQIQQPAIVVYDLNTDRQILRYELKQSDVPANNTPTGFASITLDESNGCDDIFAYIPDLTTFGIVVYSLRDNDSWRVTHSFMHFNPALGNMNIAGQSFQWTDGIFSIALAPGSGCRNAYFHPMVSNQEFQVSTCVLNNRTASSDPNYWTQYEIVGDRGANTQTTTHDIHSSGVLFYATIASDGVACWNSHRPLNPQSFHMLAIDPVLMSYPADIHVTDDEVWVITNTLPRFGYSRLDTNEYNFFVYKANVQELIAGTVCEVSSSQPVTQRPAKPSNNHMNHNHANIHHQSSSYNTY